MAKVKVAWVYHTGDISDGTKYPRKSEFESTPIFVEGTLYLTTAFNRVVALDPTSGKERWAFDPKINLGGKYSEGLMNREYPHGWTASENRAPNAAEESFSPPSTLA